MDSESTVNLLIQDIDNEVDVDVASRIESDAGMDVEEREEPLDLPGSNSGSSLASVKHVNLSHAFEDPSDTSTDIEQKNSPQLDAPVKMFPKVAADIVTPNLTTLATEVMSGPTLASSSNQVYKNRSPTASTERLKAMLENEQAEEELELDNRDIEKEPTAPKRFSLEMSKPLLPYESRETDGTSIMRIETTSDADYLDNSFMMSPDTYNQQSPQVIQSPSRIPLTNTIKINQFAMNPVSPDDMVLLSPTIPESRRVHSTTESSDTDAIPMSQRNLPSIPPTPEMSALEFIDDVEQTEEPFSQKYNTRIFSLATSLAEASNVNPPIPTETFQDDTSNGESESDMIDNLNLSDGSGQKVPLVGNDSAFTDDNNELLRDDLEVLDTGSASISEEDSEPEIFVNIDKQTEYTEQKIIEAKSEIEEFMNSEVKQDDVADLPENHGIDTSSDMSGSESVDNNTFEPNVIASLNESSSDTSVSDNKTSLLQGNEESSILAMEESKTEENNEVLPNLILQGISTTASTESEQLMEQDVKDVKDDIIEEPAESSIADEVEGNNIHISNSSMNDQSEIIPEISSNVSQHDISSAEDQNNSSDVTHSSLTDHENILKENKIDQTLPEITGFEPLHMESPFDTDGDDSFGSSKSVEATAPSNYLSVWHSQHSIPDYTPKLKRVVQKSNVPDVVSERISSFSFKPKLIHGSKIHYSDSKYKISNEESNTEADSMPKSLSQDFEDLLNKISTDNQSLHESFAPSSGHLNIWKDEDETTTFNREEVIEKLANRALAMEQIISHDPDMIVKSQDNNVVVGKADSIRSIEIESDVNSAYGTGKFYGSTLSTPSNLVPQLSDTDYATKRPVSPLKILTSRSNSPRKEPYKSPLFTNMISARVSKKLPNKEPIVDDKPDQEDVESYMSIAMIKDIKNPDVTDDFIANDQKEGEVSDKGLLYIHLDQIKVDLSDVSRHKAKFSLEIDNGINVTNTAWTSLNSDKELLLDKELEIPIRELNEKLHLTLKCKYERPEYELYEVMEKIRTGKKYGGLGKANYKYEKRYKQKALKQDPWDYIFGADGSLGSTELLIDNTFLEKTEYKEVKNIVFSLKNKWSRIAPTSKETSNSPIKRKPYSVGELSISTCYLKRTSELERFPKSLRLVHEMTKRLKIQEEIRKEGALFQEGGDVGGVIKKRYFRLAGNSLIGFHEISGKPKISINLLKAVDVIDNNDFQGKGANNRDFTNLILFGESFKVVFNDGECISFYSDTSPQETREWYNKIKQSVALNAVYQPWVKQMVKLEA